MRLARVVQIFRVLPELRILLLAIGRSTTAARFAGDPDHGHPLRLRDDRLVLFAEEDPEHWGDIGEAMLTLFVMLTLENFPVYLERGREIEPWSVVYFVTFVLIAAFVVLNVLIGVVLNSMEEARAIHAREDLRARGVEVTDRGRRSHHGLRRSAASSTKLEAMLERRARPSPARTVGPRPDRS